MILKRVIFIISGTLIAAIFGIILGCAVVGATFIWADDKLEIKDKLDISLTKEYESQLDIINSQFREAVALEEAAKAKRESASLKYALTITQIRAALKVPEDYKFDDQSRKFVKPKEK